MIKRPKPGENEDDILQMQEEFLREKSIKSIQPSAQVVNLRCTEHLTTKRQNPNEASTRKPSKYAVSKGLTNSFEKRSRIESSTRQIMGDISEKNCKSDDNDKLVECDDDKELLQFDDDKVYFPKVIPSILGNIVEKNNDTFIDFNKHKMPSEGFPVVIKHQENIYGEKNLHTSQKVTETGKIDEKMDIDNPDLHDKQLNLPAKSFIISSTEADSIHNENVNTLQKMSEKEILEEKQKLFSSLDPHIIEFLKKKRLNSKLQSTTSIHNESNLELMDTSSSKTAISTHAIQDQEKSTKESSLWDNDVLSNPNINEWLHFDSFEKDKMEWMKAIAESKKVKPDEPYEARFDFKGYLLPYTVDYTEKTKTLFHHGQEPHRPGYSITELIDLCRSTVTQQRVVALNTLAGILEYYSAGTYKDVLELPITKIFFIIRIALDENKTILLEPALKAMRNLVYNRIDEACLDALLGFQEGTYQPCLENNKSEIEELESKETELKDFHLAEIDLISALVRMDILQRIYYILDTIKPTFNCVQYCLQILIRLSRDSTELSAKIVSMERLMFTIINNFVPIAGINFAFDANIVYNRPMLAALKLLRVLSLQNIEIGTLLVSKYDLLQPLSAYISSGVDGTYGLHLQIEAFSILSNLLHYEIGVDKALSLCPLVVTSLYKHVQGTNVSINTTVISITHAAVILQFVNRLLLCKSDTESQKMQIYPLIKEGAKKWITQLATSDKLTCGHLRLICSLLDCCSTILINERLNLVFLKTMLQNLAHSKGFREIIKQLVSSSNLLSGIEGKDLLVTDNLVSLGSIVVDAKQKELPILNVLSPIPFLASLFKTLSIINDKVISNRYIEQVETYLKKLSNKTLSLTENWFTRMESDLVFNIVKVSVQCEIAESKRDLLYTIANKVCYILRADKKYELEFLFNTVIFNKQWFTTERLLNFVTISEEDELSKALSNMEDIRICYTKIIRTNNFNFEPNVVLRKWKTPILPRDWIYLPILGLYSKCQKVKTAPKVVGEHADKLALEVTKEKEIIFRCTLEWILLNEICFPDLIKDIDVTDRFCRIMCIFLCDNSLFLEPFIKMLLRKCTQVLFKMGQHFNFDKELTGLSSFQDFYMQFLEQFQAVSYGDPCFAACVLVPLAQRHNVKWRKMLWSEYAGCLRALDCPKTYLCYELKDYLYPEETDESLLKCYFRALNSNLLRPCTITHNIAEHHVNIFKLKNSYES